VAADFVRAIQAPVAQLLKNPQRGHLARFEYPELADILRASVPGFSVFALFYRWDGETLTVITLEHTAQDLPSRIASMVSSPRQPT
jgi:plasmid stabilization system protein ParE